MRLNILAAIAICSTMFAMSASAQTTVTNSNNGTTNTIPVYTGTHTLGNSPISVSGGMVGIGTTSPAAPLSVVNNNGGSAASVSGNSATSWNAASIYSTDTGTNGRSYAFGSRSGAGFSISDETAGAIRFVINSSGNVGIGTAAPAYALDVAGVVHVQQNNAFTIGDVTDANTGGSRWTYSASGNYAQIITLNQDVAWGNLILGAGLANSGNVGIGTTTPAYALDVNGNIRASTGVIYPDGSQQITAWTGVVCGGDYAESVDVTGKRTSYAPGDVLVIDPDAPGKFLKSAEPYSTFVTGIYSTKPGTVGRRQTTPHSPDEVPMAMIGIVPTKVSAENGAIHPGDLLVTSSTMGYAMKGTDRNRMLGAVIGKALGKLDSGTGVIEVVVTLQ